MDDLDKLIALISCVIELYFVYDFFHAFFQKRRTIERKVHFWSCFLINIGILYGINGFGNSKLNLFLVPIIYLIFLSICFTGEFYKKLVYLIFSCVLIIGSEFLFVILLEIPGDLAGKSTVKNLSKIPMEIISMKLLTYILFSIAKQIPKKSRFKMKTSVFLQFLIVPITSFGIMLLAYYAGMSFEKNTKIKVAMVLCYTLMIIGNILIFFVFSRYSEEMEASIQQKLQIAKQQLELNHYEQITDMNHKKDEFIHNISHYLKTIGELLREDQKGTIFNILKELNIELENNETAMYCDIPVINAILSEKRLYAQKYRLTFDAYVEPICTIGAITDMDMITVLGNLLDNALRAAINCNSYVQTRIFMQNEGHFCVIKIVNPYVGNLDRKESGFVSTKQEEGIHGIGIKAVRKVVERQGGYLEFFTDQNIFTAVVVIPIEG
ncbi:sensor histidine kinase [Anaerosporobacter faecicola]|uniref:sensor histidine kinase n=1 Tax=Anaerosporobacter faecicola TaxID=2718714 RepID=UPI00143CB42E|nr:GHKL domain-containing protein [Anaerosporobacter faecicola]